MQIFSLGFMFIKSWAGNYMCKFAFQKAVQKLLNYKSLIKTLAYPIANRFIERIKEKEMYLLSNKLSDVTAIMRSTGNH